MPQIPLRLRRALAVPGEVLRAYEDLIMELSLTRWFPKIVHGAVISAAVLFLLAFGFILLVGWAGGSFVFAIPVMVVIPTLIAMHRRQRRESGYGKELVALELRATAGEAQACFELGRRYAQGNWDAPKDSGCAVIWFRKGAELGQVEAMAEYAEALAWGHGVGRDPETALVWFEKAAALGHRGSIKRREELREILAQKRAFESSKGT